MVRWRPLLLASLLAVSVTAGIGHAQCPTLVGIVRDFNDTHADFECCLGDDRGIVRADLGLDGAPVYASATSTPTTHGAAAFDQWFHDVPGVNTSVAFPIALQPTGTPGVCGYSNFSFFPIDGQLFGNQGRSHNFHFTYQIRATFFYNGGETFSFTGDDDVWVFLNHRLAVDLGGVHGAESATISLDALASQLGISPGNGYDFDLFFAERHTTASDFAMQTSIQLVPVSAQRTTWGTLKTMYR